MMVSVSSCHLYVWVFFARTIHSTSQFTKSILSNCVCVCVRVRKLCVRELCVCKLCVREFYVSKLYVSFGVGELWVRELCVGGSI